VVFIYISVEKLTLHYDTVPAFGSGMTIYVTDTVEFDEFYRILEAFGFSLSMGTPIECVVRNQPEFANEYQDTAPESDEIPQTFTSIMLMEKIQEEVFRKVGILPV
jgi:hypothetical protein